MTRSTPTITPLTVAQLRQALETDSLWCQGVVPISKHRARAQVANPRADDNDVALILACRDDEIVGYIGVLPDRFLIDGVSHKFGWLSCWWVAPDVTDTGVGGMLLLRALSAYDRNIAVSSFSESADRAYQACRQFVPLKTIEGIALHLRCHASHGPPGAWAWRGGAPLGRCVDLLQNRRLHRRLRRSAEAGAGISIEYVRELDEEAERFIEHHRRRELTGRDRAALNWIVKYPWVLPGPLPDKIKDRYRFASSTGSFTYIPFKVYDSDDAMAGAVMIRLRDGHMDVPYCYLNHEHARGIVHVIARHAVEMGAVTLTLFNADLIHHLPAVALPCLASRPAALRSIISRKFAHVDFSDYTLQPGDGDNVFA